MRTGNVDYLNANDIESIEVLKDAASAAIYGAEGGNGVVLITTKGGTQKESIINYNFNYGIQQPVNVPEVLNAEQYATYYRDGLRHEILSAYEGIEVPEELILRSLDKTYPFNPDTLGAGTDWIGEIFAPAPVVEHSISINGGNEKTMVYASGSYFSQDGIVGGSKANFERYTARLNVDHEVKSWLSFGSKITFTHLERKSISENNEFGGVISNALTIDPLTPVYYQDTSMFPDKYKNQIYDNIEDIENSSLKAPGDKGYYGMSTLVQNEIINPVAQIDNEHSRWRTDKFMGAVNATVKPFNGLTIKTSYDIDLSYGNNNYWTPVYYYHSINNNYVSNAGEQNYRWFTWQWENVATYTKQLGKHGITLLGGMTLRDYTYEYLSGYGEHLVEESWNFARPGWVLSDSTKGAVGSAASQEKLLSYFGRAQYNYDERYMATAVLRADASSKLIENNRMRYFPSLSVGWNLSNEDFWNIPFVNFAKLRASWGHNGSLQSLGNFQYVSLIETGAMPSYYLSGGTKLTGAEPPNLSNPDLVWETSEQYDFGFDVRFLNNKLSLTADYYIKNTIDLITQGSVPEYAGNNKPSANEGKVVNKGVEIELNYKDNFGDLSVDIGANAAFNRNKVEDLESPLLGANLGTTGAVTRTDEGEPIWYFYGYEADGIFDSFDEIRAYTNEDGDLIQPAAIPGDIKFVDIDGDGDIDEEDKTKIGSPHPDITLGFYVNLEYKGVDFMASFNGALGQEVYFGAYRTDINGNNKPLFFLEDAWTPDSHSDLWPRYTVNDNNNNFSHNSMFVFDGSYIRMQNLELGYTLPGELSERLKISKFRVYVSGKNLFMLTKYPGGDPEVGNSNGDSYGTSIGVDRGLYPKSRTFSVGVNLTL